MTESVLFEALTSRGLKVAIAPGELVCNLNSPLEDYGFTISPFIESGVIKFLGCTAWEAYSGSVIGVSAFTSIKEAICWATLQAVGCDAWLSAALANREQLR